MFDNLLKQISSMIQPYMKEVELLRKQLQETNRLLAEQNELLKKGGCSCNK